MATAPTPKPSTTAATFAVVAVIAALVAGGLWWVRNDDDSASAGADEASSGSAGGPSATDGAPDDDGSGEGRGDGSDGDPGLGETAEDIASQGFPDDPRVVVVSVDGLGSAWVSKQTTPTIADLFLHGAGTLNARTEVEKTVTLPNHTGMVTGRRVVAALGGHGVTWNHTSTRSVAPGTESVFSVIDAAGGSSAVYAGKEKFEMWGRAWPDTMHGPEIMTNQTALVVMAIDDLHQHDRDLTFVHLAGPDSAGHEFGWGSAQYNDAVTEADADIDRLITAIADDEELSEEVVVIVTADHGGVPGTTRHLDRTRSENYTIPFVVWGPGVSTGDLYALNPDYRDPGQEQPGYRGPQPVRNGDVANLVTDLLGLGPVPGSELDAEQDLDVDGR
ncbi:alkaline phosphatase family protein [Nocardioides stalactiti]|uniref:alkaline phosphatase family protein n=1 Tax=Nocardioides stalactiti TaxID=2755356 RepID=UPI001601D6E7|nr:alkaline phosphatase family protein [Nocardioides stalactiti]